MTFLFNTHNGYTYDDLFSGLRENNLYYPYYRTNDVFSFFLNLIKALSSNQDLVLIDADINLSEIKGINETLINVPIKIKPLHFINIQKVIEAVQHSTSNITLFTSGTTGQPKKVVHNITTLTRSVLIEERYINNVWAFAYNPTHMAGLQVFFQAFFNMNTLVNVFNQPRTFILEQISDKNITHISATPTFYRLLQPNENKYNSVLRVTLGGEKSDPNLYDSVKKLFPKAKINNIYASTEAGTLLISNGDCFMIPKQMKEKFVIEDEELLIHRSLLGRSEYFNFSGEFYKTGDLIEWIDKESGLFKFKSRKNELINVGGYKVNPDEVESKLLALADVHQARVYGKANSILGNVLCADVKIKPGVKLSEFDIRKALTGQLQDFKIPRRIKFVEEISLTRTGKMKRL